MDIEVLQVDVENLRGKSASICVLTLSCSYAELLRAVRASGQTGQSILVSLHGEQRTASIALVHPVSAPAMLSLPGAGGPIQVGAVLTVLQSSTPNQSFQQTASGGR